MIDLEIRYTAPNTPENREALKHLLEPAYGPLLHHLPLARVVPDNFPPYGRAQILDDVRFSQIITLAYDHALFEIVAPTNFDAGDWLVWRTADCEAIAVIAPNSRIMWRRSQADIEAFAKWLGDVAAG